MSGLFPEGTTLDTVVAALADLSFAADDGVRYFHQIYTEVTREVARRIAAGTFEDGRFVTVLDAVFAGLYLEAVRAPDIAPRAWRAVFERRTRPLSPLRFALAGMNAHINRDLCVALDASCSQLGGELVRDTPRYRDYLAVNDVLVAMIDQAKAELFSPFDNAADQTLGTIDDRAEVWSITAARDSAWTHGALLHRLAPGIERDAVLIAIDRTASLIGRLLLI
jgi:hypothetical protein